MPFFLIVDKYDYFSHDLTLSYRPLLSFSYSASVCTQENTEIELPVTVSLPQIRSLLQDHYSQIRDIEAALPVDPLNCGGRVSLFVFLSVFLYLCLWFSLSLSLTLYLHNFASFLILAPGITRTTNNIFGLFPLPLPHRLCITFAGMFSIQLNTVRDYLLDKHKEIINAVLSGHHF